MSTAKHFDRIACLALALALVLTALFAGSETLGLPITAAHAAPGYVSRLFDDTYVHTLDIVMDDWDGFLATCENEEYSPCAVIIDGEAERNVGIRAKGNTSLQQVSRYGNDRYSFKIEFDHYDSANTWHGLDKLSLNNLIQDDSMMKDYLVYRLMNDYGVAAPLASFVGDCERRGLGPLPRRRGGGGCFPLPQLRQYARRALQARQRRHGRRTRQRPRF